MTAARTATVAVVGIIALLGCADEPPPDPIPPAGEQAAPVVTPQPLPSVRRHQATVELLADRAVLILGSKRLDLGAGGEFDRVALASTLRELDAGGDFLELELVVPDGVSVESLVFFLEEQGKVPIVRAP